MKFLLGLLVLMPIVVFGAILILLDSPELYRTQLTATVRQATGFELDIKGDVNWRYWPPVAIQITDVEVRPAGRDQRLLSLETAAIDLKLLPLLFGGELAINGLTIDGLIVNAEVDSNGKGNWQPTEAIRYEADTSAKDKSRVKFDVGSISISRATLQYRAPNTAYLLQLKSLTTGSVRTDEATHIAFDLVAEDQLTHRAASVQGGGEIQFNENLDRYEITQLQIHSRTQLPDLVELTTDLTLNGVADLKQGTLDLIDSELRLAALSARFNLQVTQLNTNPIFTGNLLIQPFAIRPLLTALKLPAVETRNPDVLKTFELTADFYGSPTDIHLTDLSAKLDAMAIDGAINANLGDTTFAGFDLTLNNLTLSDYLPLALAADPSSTGDAPPKDSQVLPLDLLKQYSLDGKLRVGRLRYEDYELTDLDFAVTNNSQQLQVNAAARGYAGQVKLTLAAQKTIDSMPKSIVTLTVNEMDISQLTDLEWITGRLELDSSLRFEGQLLSQVLDSLSGSNRFRIKQGSLDVSPVKNIASIVDGLRGQSSGIEDWPDRMPFESLTGNLTLNDGIEANQQLNVQLETLTIVGGGGINYWQNRLDYTLDISLMESNTSPFSVKPPLAGLHWPLHCAGALNASPASLCKPSKKDIEDLVANLRKQELKRQGQEKLKSELPELRDKAKKLLKGLFNK